MATKTIKQTKEQIDNLYNILLPQAEKETKPQYTYWQLKVKGIVYTAYTSGKVLIQGKDITESNKYIQEDSIPESVTNNRYPQAGSDEVGCGDYLGPIVVGICSIPNKKVANLLLDNGLKDSKDLSENKIMELDKLIRKHAIVSTIVLKPEQYNKWTAKGMNMVDIKCHLHKMAWEALQRKEDLPGLRVIDGFCTKERYDKTVKNTTVKGIQFIPKADGEYVSCMCGAVVARAKFLRLMQAMEREWNTLFERGGNEKADMSAVKFVQEHSFDELEKVAKLNFANTKKVRKYLSVYG